jgi:ribulose-phosphate 3-epimerase
VTPPRPIPRGEVAPSLLASDFSRLTQQIELVMDAGAKVVHFDAMDGKFVPPITIGPLVAASIAELIHDRGGILDCHLMVDQPENQVEAFANAGADVITVHPEATRHIYYTLQKIRGHGCNAGVVINPGTPVESVAPVASVSAAPTMSASASASATTKKPPAKPKSSAAPTPKASASTK